MSCKCCDWLWEKFDAWERAHSNESELWEEETNRNRELIDQAAGLQETDSAAALRLYLEAAESGSVWATERVGWHYHTGTGIAADADKALEYYYRAICAGSWMTTIYYAQLLAEQGRHDDCERVLKDGIASDFVPAYFWLARLRYEQSRTRELATAIRPLAEYAARMGHPGANFFLAQLMLFGKFGLREIFSGIRLTIRSALREGREAYETAR